MDVPVASGSSGPKSSIDLSEPGEKECGKTNDVHANKTNKKSDMSDLAKAYKQWKGKGRPQMLPDHIWTDYEKKMCNELMDRYSLFTPYRDMNFMCIVKWLSIILNIRVSEAAVWKFAKSRHSNVFKLDGPEFSELETSPELFQLPEGRYSDANPEILKVIEDKYGLK